MIEQTDIKQEEGCNRRRKETRLDVETTRSSLHSRSQKPTYPDIPGSARHTNTMNKVQLGEPRPSGTHLGPWAWHGPDGGLEATAACIRVLTDSFLVSKQISEIMRSHATSTDVPAKNMPGCLSQHTSTLLDNTFIADSPALAMQQLPAALRQVTLVAPLFRRVEESHTKAVYSGLTMIHHASEAFIKHARALDTACGLLGISVGVLRRLGLGPGCEGLSREMQGPCCPFPSCP